MNTPLKHFKSPDVYIKETRTERGKGVFAARNFSLGEVVEECPVILFKAPFSPLDEIKRVIFSWLALTKGKDGNTFALALGCGSMYNHNNPANLSYQANLEDETIRFIADRDILIHEELTINYNASDGTVSSRDDNWFKRMGIEVIGSDKK